MTAWSQNTSSSSWALGQAALTHGGDLSIVFGLQRGAAQSADAAFAALDDVNIATWSSGETADCGTIPGTTPTPCEDGQWTCNDGTCLSADKVKCYSDHKIFFMKQINVDAGVQLCVRLPWGRE